MPVASTAEYSGTPLAQKLGIKAGHVLALVQAPGLLAPLPADVEVRTDMRRKPDVAVAFFVCCAELQRRLPGLARARLALTRDPWVELPMWPRWAPLP